VPGQPPIPLNASEHRSRTGLELEQSSPGVYPSRGLRELDHRPGPWAVLTPCHESDRPPEKKRVPKSHRTISRTAHRLQASRNRLLVIGHRHTGISRPGRLPHRDDVHVVASAPPSPRLSAVQILAERSVSGPRRHCCDGRVISNRPPSTAVPHSVPAAHAPSTWVHPLPRAGRKPPGKTTPATCATSPCSASRSQKIRPTPVSPAKPPILCHRPHSRPVRRSPERLNAGSSSRRPCSTSDQHHTVIRCPPPASRGPTSTTVHAFPAATQTPPPTRPSSPRGKSRPRRTGGRGRIPANGRLFRRAAGNKRRIRVPARRCGSERFGTASASCRFSSTIAPPRI
jgi:hypothetical protein